MIAALSPNPLPAECLRAFEILATNGKIRSDMSETGHHDGWGMTAYLKPNFPEYIERQPHSLTNDAAIFQKATKWIEEVGIKLVMVHLRKSTEGAKTISNTHPFLFQEWSFCHNGTIFDSEKIELRRLKPTGSTDSERFFLYLMENLSRFFSVERSLKKSIGEFKKKFKYSSISFLLSNGKKLYAYRDCDPKFGDYYTLYTTKINGGQWVCSEPLPSLSRDWTSLPNGTLATLK